MLSQVSTVIRNLGFTINGDVSSPNEGRIAKNFIVPTVEAGPVLVRIRPLMRGDKDNLLEYGPDRFEFEAKVIDFLSKKGLSVPQLLVFPATHETLFKSQDYLAFCYRLLAGQPIAAENIDVEVARDAGKILSHFLEVASSYRPNGTEPDGDLGYIKRILQAFVTAMPAAGPRAEIRSMMAHIESAIERRVLASSPVGLVHGDFFCENLIRTQGSITGIIDFGDAYFGHALMDVTTAAMEFSVDQNGKWNMDRFESLLEPLRGWLIRNSIGFELFRDSLLANCVRFAAHTLSLGLAAGEAPSVSENPYVQRFLNVRNEVTRELDQAYKTVLDGTRLS